MEVWAPGRVNLLGEHTDYSGGLVLPAALDVGVRIEGAADDRIRLVSDRARQTVGFGGEVGSPGRIGAGLSSSAALEVAVAVALSAVGEFELPPLELALA